MPKNDSCKAARIISPEVLSPFFWLKNSVANPGVLYLSNFGLTFPSFMYNTRQ